MTPCRLDSFILIVGHGKPVDVWAMGVITYFLLAGYTPFDRDSQQQEMEAIIAGDYKFEPQEYWQNVSETAKDFVRTCLTVDPALRPTAAAALRHKVLFFSFSFWTTLIGCSGWQMPNRTSFRIRPERMVPLLISCRMSRRRLTRNSCVGRGHLGMLELAECFFVVARRAQGDFDDQGGE